MRRTLIPSLLTVMLVLVAACTDDGPGDTAGTAPSVAAATTTASTSPDSTTTSTTTIPTEPATTATTIEPTPSGEGRLRRAFGALRRRSVPVLVAVARDDEPPVIDEFGALADDGIPAASTQVDLNSITKTVTAVMVMTLVDDGVLRLDDTLGDVFGSVPADKRGVTVHQLLTHSAGFVESIGPDEEVLSRRAFLDRAFATPLRSRPGRRYHYSNVGYSILAVIIEVRRDKPFEDVLLDDVLAPAGLQGIGYQSVYDPSRSMRTAGGKRIRSASWGGHDPSWNLIGNGGLVATAPDFLRFRQAVVGGDVISARSLRRLQRPHIAEDRQGTSYYGYGLVVQELPGVGRFYWHDGGNDVFSSFWGDFTEHGDLLFVAGADSDRGDAFTATRLLVDRLYRPH